MAASCSKDGPGNTTLNPPSIGSGSGTNVTNDPFCSIKRPELEAQLLPFSTLSVARKNMTTAYANGKMIFAGGILSSGAYSSRVDIYDFATNTWTTKELAEEKFDIGVAVLANKIYLGGGLIKAGQCSNRVDIYDTQLNTWSAQSINDYIVQPLSVAAANNKVVFASGITAHIYDVTTGAWTSAQLSAREGEGNCCQNNVGGIMATAAGNDIVLAGGEGFDVHNDVDIYNTVSNTWSASKLSEYKGFGAGIAVGSVNFWAGGETFRNSRYEISQRVEIRDMNTGNSSIECLSQPNFKFSAVKSNTNIVFFTGAVQNTLKNKFDIYSLSSGTWSVGILPFEVEAAAIVCVNDVMYVAGGAQKGILSDKVYELKW